MYNSLNRFFVELIDTLWNVNEEKDKLSNNERVRINRYIMECK